MPTRYKYTLSILDQNGEWITTEHKFFPSAEMDRLDAKQKIWKLAITRNPEYKEKE